jgi:hypothetical protein
MGGVRMMFSPVKFLTQRSLVEKVWYDSNRTDDDRTPNSLAVQISNGIALVIMIVVVTGPVWNFIPWTLTPLDSPLGKYRYFISIFLWGFKGGSDVALIRYWTCHLGTTGFGFGERDYTDRADSKQG